MREGRACSEAEGKNYIREILSMDNNNNNKKEKLVAVIISTLISLAVSVIACILGVSPNALAQSQTDMGISANCVVVQSVNV